ncbi:acyl-CoA synthetase [Gordonia humi]|uniref:acyl-CoA synthetase n=1 Tax=Gordonia humi TaxID=686429 RepID=UPI003606EEA4
MSRVLDTVAQAAGERDMLVWRGRRHTYAEVNRRATAFARFLLAQGCGARAERDDLDGHQSGQDHVGLYLRNDTAYVEAMVGGFRARCAPFNINYRYVEEELTYVLRSADASVLVYHAEFAPQVAAIRDSLPDLRVLVQVPDDSGNGLLPGAVDYTAILDAPVDGTVALPEPTGDDLFILFTGGTTGMPKGVLWRQHDIYLSSMGGTPFGTTEPFRSYDDVAAAATAAEQGMRIVLTPPFMHGAAQWTVFHIVTNGGTLVLPDANDRFDAANVWDLAIAEGAVMIPVVGDAMARPLVDHLEAQSEQWRASVPVAAIQNGGAPLTPAIRRRLHAAKPGLLVLDNVGSSETGIQMTMMSDGSGGDQPSHFVPTPDTTVVDDELTRVVEPGGDIGWLARKGYVPLGYLNDAAKTAKTFPVIDGTRWSLPGDRARLLADGSIELLGRDSVTINSGGEKIYAEEVERALTGHPAIRDVIVVGRPSEVWGQEVTAVVELDDGAAVTDEELRDHCRAHIASYKIPKTIVRCETVKRSPAGKADYRWARERATRSV